MGSTTAIRYITTEEVRRALTMKGAIRAVAQALVELSTGRALVPARTSLEIPGTRTTALVMPAYLPGPHRIGLKLISLCEDNPAKGLPFAQAITIVMDAELGTPLAVLEAGYLTAVRTGAASGAATDALARKDARVGAVFGAGVQGRTQLEAIAAVRSLRKAFVVDTDARAAADFAAEMGAALGFEIEPADAPTALRDADIVSTATTSATPVLRDGDLKPGVHINAVGSYKPHVRELPGETVRRASLFVDERRSALEEAGDIIIPLRAGLIGEGHIQAEIGEVLAGLKPGRRSEDEITVFKSVGNAVEDLAVAALVLG
ncbi:MAG: Ornithine cyclodeaminase [Candidatus Aminicenantes bacterium]|nr:Ornithine cyclodeaminase [Candidatus Aminicenantes bacterium]